MSEMLGQILHRRTIRRFREEQVKEEELQQILDAGLYAPCAGGDRGEGNLYQHGYMHSHRMS